MTEREEDLQTVKGYAEAKPKQFGNLHQRMKYLIELLKIDLDKNYPGLRNAVFDLETEVKHYKPGKRPFGSRPIKNQRVVIKGK